MNGRQLESPKKLELDWAKCRGPYTLLTQVCMDEVAKWADEVQYRDGIMYFFEDGHEMQTECSISSWI